MFFMLITWLVFRLLAFLLSCIKILRDWSKGLRVAGESVGIWLCGWDGEWVEGGGVCRVCVGLFCWLRVHECMLVLISYIYNKF